MHDVCPSRDAAHFAYRRLTRSTVARSDPAIDPTAVVGTVNSRKATGVPRAMITFPRHMVRHFRDGATNRASNRASIGALWRGPARRRPAALLALTVIAAGACFHVGASSARAQSTSGAPAAPRDQKAAIPIPTRWSDPTADSLVERATARRGLQLADSTLLSYHADAHGFLAFLGQLGEGVLIPPRVVQSEELALTISWWQPGRSAQQLVGRRDTTLLPADVGYYRDRYGVILDNLPDRIRLGDGQDVRDVPHPLAASARSLYEFQRGDQLTIRIPGRDIVVDEVRFRPRDASQPAAIGSVYLDHTSAAVVRISMTFTRSAIIDKRIETLVVTLENGLVQERYWLPRRQEVEVSRGSTWLDIPARGIVRGKWEVSNYTVNERVPDSTRVLPRWSSVSREKLKAHKFEGRVVDMLPPDLQIASSEDVVHAREQAAAAVRASMLARPASANLTGRGVSDLARFTRAEGLALGIGASHRWGDGIVLSGRGRFGLSDHEVKGQLALGREPAFGRTPLAQLFVERDYRDLGAAERAGVTNSLAAMLYGSDYTTQVDTRAAGVMLRRNPRDPWMLRMAYESDAPVRLAASSASGRFEPVLSAWRMKGVRTELRGSGGWVSGGPSSVRGLWTANASAGGFTYVPLTEPALGRPILVGSTQPLLFQPTLHPLVARAFASLTLERAARGDRTLVSQSFAGLATGRALPPQWLVFAGGPWSAPGYDFHTFATRAYASQRFELRQPVPAPAIPLGKYGKAPGHITLAPFVQAIAIAGGIGAVSSAGPSPVSGVYPSVGLGTLFFFDLIRADVARGLRRGTWRFSVDIDRSFWGIL